MIAEPDTLGTLVLRPLSSWEPPLQVVREMLPRTGGPLPIRSACLRVLKDSWESITEKRCGHRDPLALGQALMPL